MENMHLIEPSCEYKKEFQDMVRQYEAAGDKEYYNMYKTALEDFNAYVLRLKKDAEGKELPQGFVPCSVYWLTNESKEILGCIRIRKSLDSKFLKEIAGNIGYDVSPDNRKRGYGREMLKLGLEKAKEIGLSLVLITCDSDNTGSRKIIEENGGEFEAEILIKDTGKKLRRYWISLS